MRELRAAIHTLGAVGSGDPWAPLLERVGDAQFVLIGEATHGTHEFYRARAAITRRLIEERGFCAVVAEADWPDAYRVNRFVRGIGKDQDATEALGAFRRFPRWMWRNTVTRDFTGWLRRYNTTLEEHDRIGFYGMDLYSLHASMKQVITYLEQTDPDAAHAAKLRYACFDHFGPEAQAYGYATSLGLAKNCEQEVLEQLVELRHADERRLQREGFVGKDEGFFAEQNARLVRNAERYYRAMFAGGINTWNLRDSHMVETIRELRGHLSRQRDEPAKIVVWAHNSHVGDARFTDRREGGEHNVGQLMREAHGKHCVLVGFTTYDGTVAAASDWDGPLEHKAVRPALEGSWERLFHEVGIPRFCLVTNDAPSRALAGTRLNRAIGVIYRPQTERWSHYFASELSRQFDIVLHYDTTRALRPLDVPANWPSDDRHRSSPDRASPFTKF